MLIKRVANSLGGLTISVFLGCAPTFGPVAPEPEEQPERAERSRSEEEVEILATGEELPSEEEEAPDLGEEPLSPEGIPGAEMDGVSLTDILVDGAEIPNVEESDWIKGSSTIEILGNDGETKITARIMPKKGRIDVDHSESYPVEIFIDNKQHESLRVKLPNRIKKYKVGIQGEDPQDNEYVLFKAKVAGKIQLGTADLLVVTLAWKGIKSVRGNDVDIRVLKKNL